MKTRSLPTFSLVPSGAIPGICEALGALASFQRMELPLAGVESRQFRMSLRAKAVRDYHKRAHPDLNQGPADLQSAALTTELCTRLLNMLRARGA